MRISITAIAGVATLLVSCQVALSDDAHAVVTARTAWGNVSSQGQVLGTAFQDGQVADGQAVYPRHLVTPRGWQFEGNQQNDCCTRCGNGWDTFCDEKKAICGWSLHRHCGRCGGVGSACHCKAMSACNACDDDCGVVEDSGSCGQSCCCKGRCGFGVFHLFGLLHHGTCGCSQSVSCGSQSAAGCGCGVGADAASQNRVITDEIPLAPQAPDDPSE